MNDNLLKFCFEVLELKNTIRTGWQEVGIPKEKIESVGEHISTTILMASAIIKEYQISNIDELKIFKMIMIKELVKIIKGEQSVISKYDRKASDRNALVAITNGLSIQSEFLALYDEVTAQQSNEANFALYVSKLESDIQAKSYDIKGDFTLENALKDINNYPEDMKKEILPQVSTASDGWICYDRGYYKNSKLFTELSEEIQSINQHELNQDVRNSKDGLKLN